MKYIHVLSALLMSCVLLCSCGELGDPAQKRAARAKEAGPDTPILIGAPAPWKIISDLGHYREGLELALKELNQEKVLDREIELVWRDDQGSMQRGKEVAQEFAENLDMVAVLGHYGSSMTQELSLIYQHYGLLNMTATSTATEITARDGLDLVFRNIPNDRQVASQLAEFSRENDLERIIVLNKDDEFGRSLANAFENRSRQIGVNVVDRRSYDFTTGVPQFRRMIKEWQDYYQYEAIFLAGVVPQAAEFIKLAREMGMDNTILGGDGLDSPQLWEIGGDAVNGVIVGTYFHSEQSGEKIREFVQAFEASYGYQPDVWAAQGYATLKLLAKGMREAESTVPRQVAQALRNMQPFQSILGHTEFDENGDLVQRSITSKVVRNQQFEYLGVE